MMGFGFIWIFVFLLLMIGAVVAILAWVGNKTNNSMRDNQTNWENNSLEILNRRYANGEISQEEYETIKRNIES